MSTSVVPKFTSNPLGKVIQVHKDDTIDTDFSLIENDSLDVFSRSEIHSDDYIDTVYGTKEESDTLFYDLDHNLNEDSAEISYIAQEDSDSDVNSNFQTLTSISKSDIKVSTFMCTQQSKQSVCLALSTGRVDKIWCQKLFKSGPKVSPEHALDMPVYDKVTEINAFHHSVVHASYLYSESTSTMEDVPYLQLHMYSTVTVYLPSGLPLHTLVNTCLSQDLSQQKFL